MSIKHTKKLCACCGKDADTRCGRCGDMYYCTKECQRIDHSEHRFICAEDNIEKDVLRAGWLLKKLFLACREHASYDSFTEWYWSSDKKRLFIHYARRPGNFFRFTPIEHTTEEERKMILSAMVCRCAVAFHSDILEKLLQHVSVKIEEVDICLKTPKKDVKLQEDGSDKWLGHFNSHFVFLASCIQSSRQWYIDPTGSQYSIHRPVTDAVQYRKNHVRYITSIAPVGIQKSYYLQLDEQPSLLELYVGIMYRQDQMVAHAIGTALRDRMDTTALTGSAFLFHTVSKYSALEEQVFRAVDRYVKTYPGASELARLPPVETYDPVEEEQRKARSKAKHEEAMLKYRP